METPAISEAQRLQALHASGLLDTEEEELFDAFVRRAAEVCGTPVSLISLVDEHRQWFKARVGFGPQETSRDVSFCAHAIRQEGIFEVTDTLQDARFFSNALVSGAPFIRFYAGVPLAVASGEKLGTLCVIDTQPRKLTEDQRDYLTQLAAEVMATIEMRRHALAAR